ncbi:MAG: isoprenyl transferase [Saprospiraceae bacterium]|jgi:undecaprenyl diphosphate synthase|nr:isoprenyl transferase [Saprospiraceae bacterium]
MDDLKKQIQGAIPKHIAIIMDGNGRWAKQSGQPRLFGHKNGVKSVREITEASAELGVQFLTLYAFSTENWNRPMAEVIGLMSLLVDTIGLELNTLQKNNIKLSSIGDLSKLPDTTRLALQAAVKQTNANTGMNLILALNYSARWEIALAVNKIVDAIQRGQLENPIDENNFGNYLDTKGIPDPELLIRTSGEQRISNFLLWQIAYTELYFTETFWPDFRKEDLYRAILDFQTRERRFGKTSEQIRQN